MEKSLKGILKSVMQSSAITGTSNLLSVCHCQIDAKVEAAEKNQMDCVAKVDSLAERLEELLKIKAQKQ